MPLNSDNSSNTIQRWTRQQVHPDRFEKTPHPQFGARFLAALLSALLFLAFWAAELVPSKVVPLLILCCFIEMASYPVYSYLYAKYKRRLLQSYCHWITDILIITCVIHFLGGGQAFLFSFGYCIVILTSSMIARRRDSYILAGLSALSFSGLLLLEYFGKISSYRIWSFELSAREQLFFTLSSIVFFFLIAHYSGLFSARIRKRGRTLEIVNAISRISSSTLTLHDILNRVLNFVLELLKADFGLIQLTNYWPEGRDACMQALQLPEELAEEKNTIIAQLIEMFTKENGPVIIKHFDKDSRSRHLDIPWLASMIGAPIIHKGENVGSFLLFERVSNKPKRNFLRQDLNLLTIITQQIAPPIVNARLYTNLEESNRNLRRAQDDIVKVEKFGALEEMITGLGHQFRNPLLAIGAAAKRMAKGNRIPDDLKFYLQIMQKETEKLEKILKDVPGFNIGKECNRSEVDVNALIERTLSLVFENENNSGIRIERDYTMLKDPLPSIDRDQFEVALYNIFCNSRDALGDKGTLQIKSELESGIESRVLRIEISDTGGGISPEQVDNIFNPFYTTKYGEAGLGLTMTYRIVENHGGDIRVLNRPGEGVTFIISIPNA